MREAGLRSQVSRVFCHCAQMTKGCGIHTRDIRGEREKGEWTRWGEGSIQSEIMTHLQEFVFMKPIGVLHEHAQHKEVSNQSEHKCLNERQLFDQFVLPTPCVFAERVAVCRSQQYPAWELCKNGEY